ncbi:MAG: Preprotein translocase, SecG subunit [Parcubacteria group bacterium GW2011_GWA2_47_8b]|uniref:Protein-export membrane protein SecG n=2 Tax=Candidatus Harrisoniibacteriota TaxID=1817905 RepID=A0A1G1ZY15_9BACT|nr:MAG: Preprotein translocase, SecG subunit [Parcubacteria group bacterium GW2011_GWA2_47_8b]KKU94774.1 MAG: Preprotein translocase, SecG subunit [Parcubacteria group bacterium GW2011_GWA1_48_11b]OGY63281.1 MAG: preprotein translocase subunit SecG [Candidatus Harrisonbacteria bacterium RIFCSPHIGHO2_12_FULL_48_16]OGY68797.1 MAG: preprotein translocase subunit SecG [Candidatus Harrisonbacteria bacterium RIFOXYA1_FULL_48_8]
MNNIITIGQIATSVILIVLILIQERSAGAGGLFGGGGGDSGFYQTRRGFEKLLFVATIVLSIIFAGLALLNLVV